MLALLVRSTPGEEGKWFAAAKDAGLLDEAIALARQTPTDPRTLARASRDHAAKEPAVALEAGIAALDWIAQGYGYEITGAEVWAAFLPAKEAAASLDRGAELRVRVRTITERYPSGGKFVAQILARELCDG